MVQVLGEKTQFTVGDSITNINIFYVVSLQG